VSDFLSIIKNIFIKFKWVFIIVLIILTFLVILAIVNRSDNSTVEPDEFSLNLSKLVQENWDDGFISGIKLKINSPDVYINGKLTTIGDNNLFPIINNNRVFLPVDLIANLIKTKAVYNGDNNAILKKDETGVEITAGKNTVIVNGKEKILDAYSFISNKKIMSPLSIMECFGFDEPVWEAGSQDIKLFKSFQTRRLMVVTNGGKLTETHGALKVLEGPNNLYVLQYATEQAAKEADAFYKRDPDILYSQPDAVINSESTEPLSWGVKRIGADFFTEQLTQNKTKESDVIVAVIDTGIDFKHPFLRGRISNIRWNFINGSNNPSDEISVGHGTHVSGIIVDSTPPNVKIMPLKVLGENGGTTLNTCSAIRYAADNGADVINMSLGGPLGPNKRDMFSEDAINYALSKNVIVIAAAGNEEDNVMNHSPAYYSRLITVAATDENDKKAKFSNFGDAIDIAAPGVSIKSSIPGGGFVSWDGTSMATPFVAAGAALLRTTNKSLSQDDVITMLSNNADKTGSSRDFGAGIINLIKLAPQNNDRSVKGISLTPKSISLIVGATEKLIATVIPGNAENPGIEWSSINPNIAKVSKDGLVTAVTPGNTVVTVKTNGGLFWSTAIVSVIKRNEKADLKKTLLAIIPYFLFLLSSFKINLSKSKRSRQFILPFIALIYCIFAMYYANKANKLITSIIAWISYYAPFIALNLNKWLIYIFNTVIVVGFLILKGILLPIISKVWSKARLLFNQTSGKFYEYNDRMNAQVLKDEYGQAKTLWKGYFWFTAVISSVIIVLSKFYPGWIFFKTPFYPVCGVLILGEIMFFLSGLTFQEMLSNIAGENDEFYRVSNYGILRRIFHDLYDDRILYDNTADSLYGLRSFDMLDKLAESKNELDIVISKYFTELKEKGNNIDSGFVRSSINMVNGKSVLINTPFYQDLTGYIVLPLVRRLLNFEKALVIVGRDSAAEDVKDWIQNGIASFCGTPELWKTEILTDKESECDVAVLRFADVYNSGILNVQAELFKHVGFVLLIEPSRIVSVGQIGLSLIVDKLGKEKEKIVFCSCDRNCDGLLDTLSHILKVNLTEVYATVPTLSNCSLMYWDAHGDFMHHRILPNIVHYLGIGTELSSIALKFQIANAVWVSSERFPVLDMRWIAGQYYNTICNYIGCSQSQEALAESLNVDANLWNFGVSDNAFITVEDEFNNLFEMTRLYSTRAKNQGFVNVISENYLLRGYMVDKKNALIFTVDPKAIPSFVPEFTNTERNNVFSLVIGMFGGKVSEEELRNKLSLTGINRAEVNAPERFSELVKKYSDIDVVDIVKNYNNEDDSMYFSIIDNNSNFASFARTLSNAYFITEDDKDKNYYIGAMLYCHVFQKYLPGQMLTYSGKYYQVQTITPKRGVVLRRAADHITGRKSYRQRRKYLLSGFSPDPEMGSCRSNRGIEIKRGFCDITVNTSGYYELSSLDNLASAHKVEINNIPERKYKNKALLCVKLPGVSEDVRFTIALLLNEIFVTLYPESYHYITAAIKMKSDKVSEILELLSPVKLQGFDDEDVIYIIEDSEIDLGLLVSVERNIIRLFEIIADYLTWHQMKLAEGKDMDKSQIEPDSAVNGTFETKEDKKEETTEEENIIKENTVEETKEEDKKEEEVSDEPIIEDISGIEEDTTEEVSFEPAVEDASGAENEPKDAAVETVVEDKEEEVSVEQAAKEASGTEEDTTEEISFEPAVEDASGAENEPKDAAVETVVEDKKEEVSAEPKVTEKASDAENEPKDAAVEAVVDDKNEELTPNDQEDKYSENDYLLYGFEKPDSLLNIRNTLKFLSDNQYDKNALEYARENSDLAAMIEKEIDFKKPDAHFCDFCAVELSGGEYDVLIDGRERCTQCANSAMKTVEQFTRLYENAIRNMETFFGIKINVPIQVRMANAKKIAKLCGEEFVPTPGFDGRVLAFASPRNKKESESYTIYVENGAPKIAAVANMVHELTHIWQFMNWDEKKIRSHYGAKNELMIYEGMAKWVELQYLYLLNEVSYAKRQEIYTMMRNDEYGRGFNLYKNEYKLLRGPGYIQKSPFNKEWPLEIE
jgi:subtilisin family serine protease